MLEEQLGKEVDKAENMTWSSNNDNPQKSSSRMSISDLGRRILFEHNYVVLPKPPPPKRTLRQLICTLHARIRPRVSDKLPSAELSQYIRNGDVLLRRLRRLLASRRKFIDFEPMKPLQEAIAQELAKEMGLQTRFYNAWNDSRYMVAYRPGTEPNPLEVRARQLCHSDRGLEIFAVEEAQRQLEPMSFRDNKLHWHQPMELKDRPMAANPVRDSLSLGKKILEEFRRDYRLIGRHLDQENREPKTT